MRVTVKISDIEVTIDRNNFKDYDASFSANGPEWRKSLLEESLLPMVKEAVEQAKELYKLRQL